VSEQPARYQRSVGGLLGSLVVLVVVVVGYVAIRALVLPDQATPEQRVDYTQVVPQAREAADFRLLAPSRLPRGWRATSVRFTDGDDQHWHLGVLTDTGRYVGLEQGDQSVASMVEEYVDPETSRGRPASVGGQTWSTYTDGGGDLAFVRRTKGATTLVVGHDVGRSVLVSYTAGLR
jgi:Protein of unknown function (DUF4245)